MVLTKDQIFSHVQTIAAHFFKSALQDLITSCYSDRPSWKNYLLAASPSTRTTRLPRSRSSSVGGLSLDLTGLARRPHRTTARLQVRPAWQPSLQDSVEHEWAASTNRLEDDKSKKNFERHGKCINANEKLGKAMGRKKIRFQEIPKPLSERSIPAALIYFEMKEYNWPAWLRSRELDIDLTIN